MEVLGFQRLNDPDRADSAGILDPWGNKWKFQKKNAPISPRRNVQKTWGASAGQEWDTRPLEISRGM